MWFLVMVDVACIAMLWFWFECLWLLSVWVWCLIWLHLLSVWLGI